MRASLMWATLLLAVSVQAAPPLEPVYTKVEEVNVASRRIVADGQPLALSSTVVIQVPGNPRATLKEVKPGMNVRLEMSSSDGQVFVVRSITVLPD